MKKSTRRQDYVSKEDIFSQFRNRAAVRHYKITARKQAKLTEEIIADRKAEDISADKAE